MMSASLSATAQGKQPVAHTAAAVTTVAAPAAARPPPSTTRQWAAHVKAAATKKAVALMDIPLSQWPSNGWAAWPKKEPLRRYADDGRQERLCTRDQFHRLAIMNETQEGWEHEWDVLMLPEHQRNAVRDEARVVRGQAQARRAVHEVCEAKESDHRRMNQHADEPADEPSDDQLVMAAMGPGPLTESQSDFEETAVSRAFLQLAAECGFLNELMADLVEHRLAVQTSASTYADYVDECVEDDLDPEMGYPRRKRRLTEAEFDAMFPDPHRCAAR
jgi:hypothetical protein